MKTESSLRMFVFFFLYSGFSCFLVHTCGLVFCLDKIHIHTRQRTCLPVHSYDEIRASSFLLLFSFCFFYLLIKFLACSSPSLVFGVSHYSTCDLLCLLLRKQETNQAVHLSVFCSIFFCLDCFFSLSFSFGSFFRRDAFCSFFSFFQNIFVSFVRSFCSLVLFFRFIQTFFLFRIQPKRKGRNFGTEYLLITISKQRLY